MRKLLALLTFALVAVSAAMAQQLPDFYLRGTFNGWGASAEYKFNRAGNVYSLHLNHFEGEFKIATAEWGGIEYGADTAANGELNVGVGSYVMKLSKGRNYACRGVDDVTFSFEYKEDEDLVLTVTGKNVAVAGLSGTLPVLYINVYNDATHTSLNNEIISRDLAHKNYFTDAEYWLDINGCEWMASEGAASIGSEADPLPLQIKARGNWTRIGFSKKPFKLKLDAKQTMLGLTKSKHFALIAHADDDKGYLKNFTGFNLGKRIGLPWTPAAQPVEVVINGNYRGLYFLTESIRVDAKRVDITELEDMENDPALCSGGYLVELDNYDEDNQIRLEEKTCVGGYTDMLRVTFDTPEEYSELQLRFITDQFTAMNDAVGDCRDELWSYLDLDDAVRYYLVEEILSHVEAYHGSTYLFRDRGEGQKWHFSPLWDCGNAFNGPTDDFFYRHAPFGCTWIASMRENERFNDKVKDTWRWFMSTAFNGLYDDIDAYVSHIAEAAKCDRSRWAGEAAPAGGLPVCDNSDMDSRKTEVIGHLNAKIEFLKSQFGHWGDATYQEPVRDNTPAAALPEYLSSAVDNVSVEASVADGDDVYYDLAGRRIVNPATGVYIHNNSVVIKR
ncbi:MAG: CotH kinase family protein [Muribaculaceae bacterium]|nr:CotH kinase family protein [Muribaculaceae bacterium]